MAVYFAESSHPGICDYEYCTRNKETKIIKEFVRIFLNRRLPYKAEYRNVSVLLKSGTCELQGRNYILLPEIVLPARPG
jgi:hypothetical protein